MRRDYTSRINAALLNDSPAETVADVKSAVIAELQALDSQIEITNTEYFNHSFVPDLVARWPHDPTVDDRYVYLRFNSDLQYFISEVDLIQDNHPIVVGLGETPRDDGASAQKLHDVSNRTGTLVTDPTGLEQFIEDRPDKLMQLMGTALAQGGKGLVDAPVAYGAAGTIKSGVAGAIERNTSATGRATVAIDQLLDERHASRMMRVFQALWIGAGGHLEEFPGRRDLGTDVSDDALQFLLEFEDIDDEEFWYRLGYKLTVGQLSRLSLPHGSSNLDRLMKAIAGSLSIRSCRIVEYPEWLDDQHLPYWMIARSTLALRMAGYIAYLAETADHLQKNIRAKPSPGISIEVLQQRSHEVVLDEVELQVGDRKISLSSVNKEDVVRDDFLPSLQSAFTSDVEVQRAVLALSRTRHLTCDFTTLTATTRGPIKVDLPTLALAAIPLLVDVSEEEFRRLADMMPSRTQSLRHPSEGIF
ncbi:hypothetical protein ACBR40_34465 [Nonomuraea sp. AD125B]|uniref:hypothetical protein n=1 Tax=Nonomuraea sp. AD125B TaxID=3242897 RepID=UPI0035284F91